MAARIVVLTAPSGAGKTTLARRLLQALPQLSFSVSATTRAARSGECHGRDYFFVPESEFNKLISEGELLEYEEVYPGYFYGTLRTQAEQATPFRPVLLDVDVRGALSLRDCYGADVFAVFIKPPSLCHVEERLRARGTESASSLRRRLERASREMRYMDSFDAVVVNDNLERAASELISLVATRLTKSIWSPPQIRSTDASSS